MLHWDKFGFISVFFFTFSLVFYGKEKRNKCSLVILDFCSRARKGLVHDWIFTHIHIVIRSSNWHIVCHFFRERGFVQQQRFLFHTIFRDILRVLIMEVTLKLEKMNAKLKTKNIIIESWWEWDKFANLKLALKNLPKRFFLVIRLFFKRLRCQVKIVLQERENVSLKLFAFFGWKRKDSRLVSKDAQNSKKWNSCQIMGGELRKSFLQHENCLKMVETCDGFFGQFVRNIKSSDA